MAIHDWTKVEDGIFHDFHMSWLMRIRDSLNDTVLPGEYYAMSEQHAGPAIPDVLTLQKKGTDESAFSSGGTVLAAVAPQVTFRDRAEGERKPKPRARRIAIRHVTGDRVVAFIEIVSPGNKSSRAAIRKFIDKSTAFVEDGIHLLILDLFPPTTRDPQGLHPLIWSTFHKTAFSLPADKPLTLASYNAGPIPESFVEPVAVGDPLPPMPLFLTPDEYVNVPLEPTYLAAWNAVPKRWRDVIEPGR